MKLMINIIMGIMVMIMCACSIVLKSYLPALIILMSGILFLFVVNKHFDFN